MAGAWDLRLRGNACVTAAKHAVTGLRGPNLGLDQGAPGGPRATGICQDESGGPVQRRTPPRPSGQGLGPQGERKTCSTIAEHTLAGLGGQGLR